jgi:hypothetical protein
MDTEKEVTPKERIIEGVKKAPAKRKAKSDVKYPDVSVQLVGKDGNAFTIIGEVNRALRRAGHVDALETFMAEATAAGSYDEFLRVVMKTVNVR